MKLALLAVSAMFLGAMAMVSQAEAPAAPAPAVNLTGTWNGTSADLWVNRNVQDGMVVKWVVTQTGAAISGTVTSAALDPSDGSCSSCHRAKSGTLSGTVSGTTLTLTMDFPGLSDEITPACRIRFTGNATIADQAFTASYSGSDSCEGLFSGGILPLTRESETLPSIVSQPASQLIPTGRTISLGVAGTGTAPLSYQWYAGPSGTTTLPIAGATSSNYTTSPITATSRFWVRLSNAYGTTVDSAAATITPYVPFTDDVLTAGATVIAVVHIQELRTRIDALRARVGLGAYPYADAALAAGTSSIRAQHILDLRAALADVYVAMGRTAPSYTDPGIAAGVAMKAVHITELRAAVIAIE
jgi:hypothetical protein